MLELHPGDMSSSSPRPETAARERQVLEVARRLLRREGPHGLTMDKVCAELSFSKGTLYKLYASREDLILAFLADEMSRHRPWFERAALFRGRPRERFTAMALAASLADRTLGCEDLPPTFLADEQVFARATPEHRAAFQREHSAVFAVFNGVVRDAIVAGDLPPATEPELVSSAAWSLHLGASDLYRSRLIFSGLGADAFGERMSAMFHRLLDGFHWRPLGSDHDYGATVGRVLREVFPVESERLGLRPPTGAGD